MTERQESDLLSMEETQTSYLDQVEELTHKLSQAETKVQTYESSRLEEGAKVSIFYQEISFCLEILNIEIKGI